MKFKFTPNLETNQPISDGKEIKIITLGGTTTVTKNMTIYETENDIIVVDCGFGFPDSEMLGVDIVLPDITYLMEKKNKVRAIFITHGHEDHTGALPYVLKDLNVPIYATRLVKGLIEVKLKEKEMLNGVSLKVVDPEAGSITVGSFTIDYFRVNHSIPDSCGLFIKANGKNIIHCADYKFDWTPVLDKPFDVNKLSRLAVNGVDLLLSDCLGSTTEGYARSEKSIEDTFDELLTKAEGKQVLITTVSSNISRMAQAIASAIKHGRKVVFSGRSIDQAIEVSLKLSYITFDKTNFVPKDKARKFKQSELLYIVAGAYGQSDSAISRVSRGEHKDITLEEGAFVIFSADPNPPGVRDDVDILIDRLTLKNTIVVYSEIQENLHVSGHGLCGDLKLMAALSKAKYFMPIGGTVKHMRAYTNMLSDMGIDRKNVFELLEGESVILSNVAKKGEKLNVQNVFVDGSVVGDIGEKVIEDRNILASDGIVVVAVPINKKDKALGQIDIITRGFVYVKESKTLLDDASNIVRSTYGSNRELNNNYTELKRKFEGALEKFFFKKTGREPLVLVSIIEV